MANKAQAKAAIDAVVALIKTDIDNLPVGVNIKDGAISFGPSRWSILLDAGTPQTAESWTTSILAYLNSSGRPEPIVTRHGRRVSDGMDSIEILSAPAQYLIVNFNF